MSKKLIDILEECIEKVGVERTQGALNQLLTEEDTENILTIIANSGIHEIRGEYLRGEVYSASHGNLDFSSQEVVLFTYRKILADLLRKLYEKPWKRIYLIPTGHSTLALQIKLFVYHILRVDTIDLFYHKGGYFEIFIDHRDVALTNKEGDQP